MRGRQFWLTLAAAALVALGVDWAAKSPVALAQTCPANQSTPGFTGGGSVFGRVAAQWEAYFAAKVDANNGTLCSPTILGTLNLTAAIVVNALGYTPLAQNGSNASNPFYIDTSTGFGVSRSRSPLAQLEVNTGLTGSGLPVITSRTSNVPAAAVGHGFYMLDSDLHFVEYATLYGAIYSNNAGSHNGILALRAAKNGSETEYLRVGEGGACVAEGGVFCAANLPPTDGFLTKGPQRIAPVAFASLPTCNAGMEGAWAAVNNSNTATFNATIAGGGSNHVAGYCNASNWVVH